MQEGCGRRGDVAEYLSDTRPYQIEHLFANKPARHSAEAPDPVRFRSLRNQLGGLVLLLDKDNASLGAMPFEEKVKRYGRQDVLVGVLNREYHSNFPRLHEFTKANGLESLLRPFRPNTPMAEVIKVRQELYLRLCSRIWSLERMGIRKEDLPEHRDPFMTVPSPLAPPARARPRTDVARMVSAGVVEPGSRIVLTHKGTDHWAEIDANGRIALKGTGALYSKADDAGCIIRNTRTCDGMKLWHLVSEDGTRTPLRELRDRSIVSGVLRSRRSRVP
ncbi:hypothetical protein GCM10010466_24490 [Planomonospora alba]|uniref:Uncharacterized protein n=1 Tax=Planomonospora alba TaxID=161354 RepID=A0ABP6N0Y6_9ACTN